MLDAKPIPGTRKIVASFSPSHGRPEHMGTVTIVDPRHGPDDVDAAVPVSQPGKFFRDPYAISENCFLVADARGILLMDGDGKTEVIHGGSTRGRLQCHEPRPLRTRPRERIVPSRVEPAGSTARLVLSDIHEGRNMAGVERGEIEKLLILEQLPKPVNFSGGPWPLSIGGTFSLSRVLGTVPVEPDGSASFEVPALRSLFFVALDKNGLSVKRMQSFVSLQPGESTSCVGCHEHRGKSPHVQTSLMALYRPASRIEPIADMPDVFDFARDVQPILDLHCIECHSPQRYDGQVDLTGDHTPLFTQSYWALIQRGLVIDGRNQPFGNRPPRSIGSGASRLMELIDGSHYDVTVTERERKIVRLWIDTSATLRR
jgi:hydrazine synthase alpha subunit-like protein